MGEKRFSLKANIKILIASLSFALFFANSSFGCSAIDAWPGSAGTIIATYSDASGIIWHEERQSLFLVRNSGALVEINSSGAELHSWPVAGDLEGITLAENKRYLYLGIENPDSIVEFDLQTESLTGKSWDLTTWMTGPDNSGLEGLAYRSGYFYAGLQANGKIYVFNVNLNVNGDVDYIETITPNASYADISGIDYNSDTGITYAIFDTANALVELNAANETVNQYSLPGTAQEGFTLKTNCMSRVADIYIANDDSGAIVKYANYPITCLDADSDGVNYNQDCNDYDAAIFANQIYYRDADEDGLGSDATISTCSFATPTGYVVNSSDQNDSDYDNDGSPTGSDCNENDNSLTRMQAFYRDADGDGLGDSNTTVEICSLSAPEGYVANSSDAVDIVANGRQFYVNGAYHDFFTIEPSRVKFTNLNFYNDDYEEVIAVGITKKRAYITIARVQGSNVTIAKRVMLKKKYKTVSIATQPTKNKFTTRFNGRKKYVWKIKSSGSFSKSH
ncbi:MAG: SdiA-regulated domain-containing protein [Parcubacteria group bacterium]|jgi:hypothetical protein